MISVMASIFITIPTIVLNAQKTRHLEYAFGHTIEVGGGCTWLMAGTSPTAGGDFNFRYTYFWGKHFGVFGQFGLSGHSKRITDIFNTLDPSFEYEPMRFASKHPSTAVSHITVGLAYRLDHGIWSFRPRIGIGFGNHEQSQYSYYRFHESSTSDTPERVNVSTTTGNGSMADYGIGTVTLSAGLQITCSVCDHFFLFAGVDGLLMPTSWNVTEEIYSTERTTYDNWVQAVLSSFDEPYKATHYLGSTSSRHKMCGTLGLNIGIGWNIGYNRNNNGKYGRK